MAILLGPSVSLYTHTFGVDYRLTNFWLTCQSGAKNQKNTEDMTPFLKVHQLPKEDCILDLQNVEKIQVT